MFKLLIADRDKNERMGLNWLVSSFFLTFEVLQADSFDGIAKIIENEQPDVVIIELDMIPKESWGAFKKSAQEYVKQMIVMTTEATFDRAMQAIEVEAKDLWIKPNSPLKIKSTLQRCMAALKKNKSDEPRDHHSGAHELSYHSLFLDDESEGNSYHVMILQTENAKELKHLLAFLNHYDFLHKPVKFPLRESVVCVFTREKNDLHQEAHRLMRDWEERYHEPLAIVIHANATEAQSLNQTYLEADKALKLTFIKGFRQIIHVDSVREWIPVDPFLTPAEIREWVEMLNEAAKDKIKTWMYREFLNLSEPYPEPGLLRLRLNSVLAQLRRFMKTYYLDNKQIEQRYHRLSETILYSSVAYRIVQDVLLFIDVIIDEAKNQKDLSRIDVVERGILYMENHYYDPDLTLERVANFVDRNPAYLSNLFTKKQGTSFRQILTQIRINEAKRYLLETKWTIQEIAEKTGFTNANYFSRIFKEVTGATPREYRVCGDLPPA